MRDDFAAFILTHARADNVVTYQSLRKHGYTGRIVLLVDDTDPQIKQYRKSYGDQVHVFSKREAMAMTDAGDNFGKGNAVVFARNYAFAVAEELGLRYFLALDDDYRAFWWNFNNRREYITKNILTRKLDSIFSIFLDFYIESGALTVAMTQGGDFIGGKFSTMARLHKLGRFHRKAMNSFFCSTDRPFQFTGRINEDTTTYVTLGRRGGLFITEPKVRLSQLQTQSNSGGLTELYLDLGTYVKSFYSVMYAPSCVRIIEMGNIHRRLHHSVQWKHTTPMILREDQRKEALA